MAKNKLTDLNNHLFTALERLNDEDLSDEKIEIESKRADSVVGIANQIISAAKVTLDAMRLISNGNLVNTETPEIFGFNKSIK